MKPSDSKYLAWSEKRTRDVCDALAAADALDEDTDAARLEGYGYNSLRILTNIKRANAIRTLLEQQHYACGCAFTPRDNCIGHHGRVVSPTDA